MLDRVDPGAQAVLDRGRPMRVGARRPRGFARLVHAGRQFVRVQLARGRLLALFGKPAARHEFDPVRAHLDALPHRPADRVRPVGLLPVEPAVTARHGDHPAARDDPRPEQVPGADRVPQHDIAVIEAARVPDRGDPGQERAPGVVRRPQHADPRIEGELLFDEAAADGDVGVGVDQARQHVLSAEIHDAVRLSRGEVRADPRDPPVRDEHVGGRRAAPPGPPSRAPSRS